jgi:hypothetical protein
VTAEIQKVSAKLDKVEADVEAARARQDKDEVAALRKEKEQLREEKLIQLRARERMLQLLSEQQGVLKSAPAGAAHYALIERTFRVCSVQAARARW